MGLRYSKLVREEARRAEEVRGRRVVAEVPTESGELVLFLEDSEGFYWAGNETRKRELLGARLRLNGATVAEAARAGFAPPAPRAAGEYEARERWDVLLYRSPGAPVAVACGSLREGVSREAATRVFEAVRSALEGK